MQLLEARVAELQKVDWGPLRELATPEQHCRDVSGALHAAAGHIFPRGVFEESEAGERCREEVRQALRERPTLRCLLGRTPPPGDEEWSEAQHKFWEASNRLKGMVSHSRERYNAAMDGDMV